MSSAPRNVLVVSHHADRDVARCVVLSWHGSRFYVCSRCFGSLLGMLAATLIWWLAAWSVPPFWCLLAAADWFAYATVRWSGRNVIRITSGILLGVLYFENVLAIFAWRWRISLVLTDAVFLLVYATGLLCLRRRSPCSVSPRKLLDGTTTLVCSD